jgi:hypothetical protein
MKTNAPIRGGRALALMLLALVATLPVPALAAGQNYGRLAGYVYDPTGAALAEVPLTVSGPAMQQPQSRTSGEDGRFEFDTLPPGEEYVLEVKVEGFTPIKRKGIVIRLGQTTPLDVKLEVLTETQAVATYEIVEKVNPIINPESAQMGAVMTAEKAEMTPIFTQAQAVPQLVAGVGQGSTPSLRGGLTRYGKFFIDGMDTTDVAEGSISAPITYYAAENFEVITGGLDAQYNSLGLVQNVVTKSGSNKFTRDAHRLAGLGQRQVPGRLRPEPRHGRLHAELLPAGRDVLLRPDGGRGRPHHQGQAVVLLQRPVELLPPGDAAGRGEPPAGHPDEAGPPEAHLAAHPEGPPVAGRQLRQQRHHQPRLPLHHRARGGDAD